MALIAVAACSRGPARDTRASATPSPAALSVVVSFGPHAVSAEVAADEEARATGLMGRRQLGADAGMLFLFPARQKCPRSCFWMKDTLIPLSIAFLERTGAVSFRVVGVVDMQPCRAAASADCPEYGPRLPYDAALEVNLGWLKAAGVADGSTAEVSGNLPNPL